MTRMTNTPDYTPPAAAAADLDLDAIYDIFDRLDASMSGDASMPVRNDIDTNRQRIDKLLDDLSDHFHRIGAGIADLDTRLKTLEPDDD